MIFCCYVIISCLFCVHSGLSDDFIFSGGHCRRRPVLWGAVTSPAVPGKYRGSGVRSLGRAPSDWVRIMSRQDGMAAALQLQHDAGLMALNLQVLGQYVTSLNRMSTKVMRLARSCSPRRQSTLRPRCPECIAQLSKYPLWGLPLGPGVPGPMPVSSHNDCLSGACCLPENPTI